MESYGTTSSQYTQVIEEVIRKCGFSNFFDAAFSWQLEKIVQLHVNEHQTFVRFAVFLRMLVHKSELNNYTPDLNSSNLIQLFRSKLHPAVLFKREEHGVHNGNDHAILKDLTDWLDIYCRACENLEVLPVALLFFTRNKDWKNSQQQASLFTMLNSQHTEKKG